jgi:hypothetical protein
MKNLVMTLLFTAAMGFTLQVAAGKPGVYACMCNNGDAKEVDCIKECGSKGWNGSATLTTDPDMVVGIRCNCKNYQFAAVKCEGLLSKCGRNSWTDRKVKTPSGDIVRATNKGVTR